MLPNGLTRGLTREEPGRCRYQEVILLYVVFAPVVARALARALV